jgi:predicted permease
MFDFTLPFSQEYEGEARRMNFLERAAEEIRAIPGVMSAATTDDLPFSAGGQGYYFSLEERPDTRQDRSGAIKYISPGYFETLGATIVRGRPFTAQDNRANAPRVLVVNQRLVDLLFGNEDPIGRRLNVNNQSWEIVGVVADMRLDNLHSPPRPTFFAPHWHFPWGSSFIVRTAADPLTLADEVAAAIHRLDPNLPLANLRTGESAMADSIGPQKLILNLIGAFAATALLLACIGLYGVMAYSVVSRQRELSIRNALGAARTDIMKLVVGGGLRLIAIGLSLGLLGALALARVLANRMQGISEFDPIAFASAGVVLGLVGLIACWLPARRAAQTDPITALRSN